MLNPVRMCDIASKNRWTTFLKENIIYMHKNKQYVGYVLLKNFSFVDLDFYIISILLYLLVTECNTGININNFILH